MSSVTTGRLQEANQQVTEPKEWVLKKILNRALVIARNPQVRPFEVWALRVALAYVAVKLGVDVKDIAQ